MLKQLIFVTDVAFAFGCRL